MCVFSSSLKGLSNDVFRFELCDSSKSFKMRFFLNFDSFL